MAAVHISPKALVDLEEIMRYVQSDLESDLEAENIVKGMIGRIRELESSPKEGAPTSFASTAENNYRCLSCDNYSVFYRYEEDVVYIVRIMFCAEDVVI